MRVISLLGDNPFKHKNPVLFLGMQILPKHWAVGSRWDTACSMLATVSLQAVRGDTPLVHTPVLGTHGTQ